MSVDYSTPAVEMGMCPRTRKNRARPPLRLSKSQLSVEILVQSPVWNTHRNAKSAVRRILAEAAAATATTAGELAVVLTSDLAIRELNRRWRGKNVPTNVLSFPTQDTAPATNSPRLLGDVVIAYETCEREARAQHVSFMDHLGHLALHGFLHLLGYDHVAAHEAQRMEALEAAILARLPIANPYPGSQAAAEA